LLQRNRRASDPEDADGSVSGTPRGEAFEDQMVDTMVLEDAHNMDQALDK